MVLILVKNEVSLVFRLISMWVPRDGRDSEKNVMLSLAFVRTNSLMNFLSAPFRRYIFSNQDIVLMCWRARAGLRQPSS